MMFTTYSSEVIQSKIDSSKVLIDTSENELPDKYELKKCCDWIRENNYQTTCLQFPESLLNDGTSIALYIQKELERTVYVLADTAYGSCCVDEVAAEHVNADSIIHFGHACLSPVIKLPVLYVFVKDDLDVRKFYECCNDFQENVIVFYDDVFHHFYSELCSVFRDKKNINISRLRLSNEEIKEEEVMCGRVFRRESENVTGIYIGNESVTLHNLVLSLPDFKWLRYSKEGELVEYNFNRNKFLMQRSHLVEKIRAANVIGILIGTLGIKNYLEAIDRIKELIKRKGKKCYLLAVGKPNVAKLANFPEMDVFVLIACQEHSLLKSFKDYYKPIVSLFEVELALTDRPFTSGYTSDFRELLPGGSFHREIPSEPENNSKEVSQELMEKEPGTVVEYSGADFLASRSWRGLELKGNLKVSKAVKGRSGIPLGYENELETLSRDEAS